jgi:acyl-CoA synthetase (AMP-forming)/AMP-acid ligase II
MLIFCRLLLTDQIEYWALVSGTILAGYVPFALSPRNSAQAIEFLIKSTDTKYVFASEDKFEGAQETCTTLGAQCFAAKTFLTAKERTDIELPALDEVTIDDPALILHSSGNVPFLSSVR